MTAVVANGFDFSQYLEPGRLKVEAALDAALGGRPRGAYAGYVSAEDAPEALLGAKGVLRCTRAQAEVQGARQLFGDCSSRA